MLKFKPYLDQDYESIKAQCLKSGKLFEDDKFPPQMQSLFKFKYTLKTKVIWKRPHEIVDNPQFIVNFIEPNDLDQGQLGNCWVIASAAALVSVPSYINRVIPQDQNFEKNNYAGIFHFRFWCNGEWIDIVVDDLIPCDPNNNIIFCHNNVDKNEIFGPLLEKAYAKLNICYEFTVGGLSKDALIDFTGGVNETFDLKRSHPSAPKNRFIDPNKLWELILRSFNLRSLMSCSAFVKPGESIEARQSNGIIVGHAYSLIGVYEIFSKNSQFDTLRTKNDAIPKGPTIRLLKIRNPWGQRVSYNGRWSLGASDWDQISDNVKKILHSESQIDGQFFMIYEDYLEFFDSMDTVHVDLNALSNEQNRSDSITKYDLVQFRGAWIPGVNSGGGGINTAMYWRNPQYPITIYPVQNKQKVAVIISLLQTASAMRRALTDGTYENAFEAISFRVYSILEGAVFRYERFEASDLQEVNRLKLFKLEREVSKRIELLPGNYIILPCCYDRDRAMRYLLRLYIETSDPTPKDYVYKPVNVDVSNSPKKSNSSSFLSCCFGAGR